MAEYLGAMATGETDNLPKPNSVIGRYLYDMAKNGGTGGGGEYFETVGKDTLTWDGNTEGLPVVVVGGGAYLYKVSDVVPTLSEMSGGVTAIYAGQLVTVPAEEFVVAGNVITDGQAVFVVSADNSAFSALGVTFPEKGIWFISAGGAYVSALTINGYTGFEATRLKEEYAPDDYFVTFTYEGTTIKADKTYLEILNRIVEKKVVNAILITDFEVKKMSFETYDKEYGLIIFLGRNFGKGEDGTVTSTGLMALAIKRDDTVVGSNL